MVISTVTGPQGPLKRPAHKRLVVFLPVSLDPASCNISRPPHIALYTTNTAVDKMSEYRDGQSHSIARSDSSASGANSDNEHVIHQPVPTRPRLPNRTSSGPLVVPRDSLAVGPVDAHFGPDDVRAMSPRRTSEDIDKMGKEAREEMQRFVD